MVVPMGESHVEAFLAAAERDPELAAELERATTLEAMASVAVDRGFAVTVEDLAIVAARGAQTLEEPDQRL